ncbi:MAG: ATP synthase F1 subunit delta [Brachyspira sp.]|nr:ATP synthase F1 subunit delta [Brachyspira sp.]
MTTSIEQISLSAKNYSKALVEMVRDNVISFEDLSKDLATVSEILETSQDLRLTLENPTVSEEVKSQIVEEVFKNEVHPQVVSFLKVLIDKNRFSEFSQIKADYEIKLDDVNKIQAVEITSAVELSEEYRERILQKLSEKLQKNIRPNWKVDENIIAGLIYRINDNVIDTSIKSKLDKLNKNLM